MSLVVAGISGHCVQLGLNRWRRRRRLETATAGGLTPLRSTELVATEPWARLAPILGHDAEAVEGFASAGGGDPVLIGWARSRFGPVSFAACQGGPWRPVGAVLSGPFPFAPFSETRPRKIEGSVWQAAQAALGERTPTLVWTQDDWLLLVTMAPLTTTRLRHLPDRLRRVAFHFVENRRSLP